MELLKAAQNHKYTFEWKIHKTAAFCSYSSKSKWGATQSLRIVLSELYKFYVPEVYIGLLLTLKFIDVNVPPPTARITSKREWISFHTRWRLICVIEFIAAAMSFLNHPKLLLEVAHKQILLRTPKRKKNHGFTARNLALKSSYLDHNCMSCARRNLGEFWR